VSVRAHPVGTLRRPRCEAPASTKVTKGEKGRNPAVLTEQQMRILAFERSLWRSPGVKDREIKDAIGITPTRYYQILNDLIDSPDAAQFDPALVARLRRRREQRGKLRSPD